MMRKAMTMIEVIFAIVIIAISVMAIPSMMEISSKATKGVSVDDDILKRMSGELTKIFQTRWDGNYIPSVLDLTELKPLWIATVPDLNCSRGSGNDWYRLNPASSKLCNDLNASPAMAATPATGDGNLTAGIEKINNFNYNFEVNATTGDSYHVPVTYQVSYVNSTVSPSDSSSNTVTATWVLGSSGSMTPSASGTQTHLKRIVATASGANPDVNITLTFFKSNKGN
jgi:prepilin-type N-terminal cleavage/methylation domain-containing protein